MQALSKGNRIRKRVVNACQRCRQQKTRCSGLHPCVQCSKRKVSCVFEEHLTKVLVTKGYITDLQKRITELEKNVQPSERQELRVSGYHNANQEVEDPQELENVDDQNSSTDSISSATLLTNDLRPENPQFIPDTKGTPVYMGTSSNWAFGRRILSAAYGKILQSPVPIDDTAFQAQVYQLTWTTEMSSHEELSEKLPTSDFAEYLINAVRFRCGQIFHLFDDVEFEHNFMCYRQKATQHITNPQIWYTHFLLVLALGKALAIRNGKDNQPAGAKYFTRAMKFLPNIAFLHHDKIVVMEMLCCASLYLQSIDFRCAAYVLIGQAMRMALNQGLNTNMRSDHFDDAYIQRSRRVWWTVLALDRQMTALQGVPIAIRVEDINAEFPCGDPGQCAALQIHATLSHLIAEICNDIYGTNQQIRKSLLSITKTVIRKIGDITDHLKDNFPLQLPNTSRISAYLHLLYHQCVLLASRPIFFHFFQKRLETKDSSTTDIPRSGTLHSLLSISLESAHHVFKILEALNEEGLLETFLPFDLEAIFTAVTIIQIAHAADNDLVDDIDSCMKKTNDILTEMIHQGNLIARCLKSELNQLYDLLNQLPGTTRLYTTNDRNELAESQNDNINWQDVFTTGNMLYLADSLDADGEVWIDSYIT